MDEGREDRGGVDGGEVWVVYPCIVGRGGGLENVKSRDLVKFNVGLDRCRNGRQYRQSPSEVID